MWLISYQIFFTDNTKIPKDITPANVVPVVASGTFHQWTPEHGVIEYVIPDIIYFYRITAMAETDYTASIRHLKYKYLRGQAESEGSDGIIVYKQP